MKKLRKSLLAQYLLIILVAMMILPFSMPVLSIIYYNSIEQAESSVRYYNGTDLEEMWIETAKGLSGASEQQIHQRLSQLKNVYQEASMYWVDDRGQTKDKFPESIAVPDTWTALDAIHFMKKIVDTQSIHLPLSPLLGMNNKKALWCYKSHVRIW